jgi:hypothetical protein
MADYLFCRVNDERHSTREAALADMLELATDEWFYTRSEARPSLARGTPMVAIGSHGGRGLFMLGLCLDAWEALSDEDLPYRHRVRVLWDGAIYETDLAAAVEGLSKFNWRSWTYASQADYGLLVGRVLAGDVADRVRRQPS